MSWPPPILPPSNLNYGKLLVIMMAMAIMPLLFIGGLLLWSLFTNKGT